MNPRWFLSQFYTDSAMNNMVIPICTAYGTEWFYPTAPVTANGWALVSMLCNAHQIDAAAQDSRVLVLPQLYDPSALPAAVITAYSSWGATTGMSLAQLLVQLAKTEPLFGQGLN